MTVTTRSSTKSKSRRRKASDVPRRLASIGASLSLILSIIVLGISMPHLADGVLAISDCGRATAIFMACVFDLSQIAAEYTSITLPLVAVENRRMKWACVFIMTSCTLVSIVMNVRAFSENSQTTFETAMAYTWGILLPILVLLLCYIASVFILKIAEPRLSTDR